MGQCMLMWYVSPYTNSTWKPSFIFQFFCFMCIFSASWLDFLFISHIAEFVVIHNGIITNYKDIKTYLVSIISPLWETFVLFNWKINNCLVTTVAGMLSCVACSLSSVRVNQLQSCKLDWNINVRSMWNVIMIASTGTCLMPWLQLRFDYDMTTIRLQHVVHACCHSTRFDASKEWKCQFFVIVVSQSNWTHIVISITFVVVECVVVLSYRSHIVVELQLWYRLYWRNIKVTVELVVWQEEHPLQPVKYHT